MHEKDGIIELTEAEARLANYYPRFPLGLLPEAIAYMKNRQAELQTAAEDGWEKVDEHNRQPLSIYAFRLGELVDRLEELR
jgi:hypothetical protein